MKPGFSFISFLKIAGLVLLACFATSLLLGAFYGDEIKKLLIENVNRNLNTEIRVRSISFSVLRHFPFASVEMNDVSALDAVSSPAKDTLLNARKLSLLFNLTGIFSKDVSIKKIIVENGVVHIREFKDGSDNYHFWKRSSGKGAGSVIDLKNVTLEDMQVTYENAADRQQYSFSNVDGSFSGTFSTDEFELNTDATMTADHIYISGINYAGNKEIRVQSILNVNNRTAVYEFRESKLRIEDLNFDVGGTVAALEKTTRLNLQINSSEAELRDLLSLLPQDYKNYFADFKSSGKFVFQSAISGFADLDHSPDVKFNFTIHNGSLSPREGSVAMENLVLKGVFVKKDKHPSELDIQSFRGTLSGRSVEGRLALTDFANPFLNMSVRADLDLNSIRPFIKHDTLEMLSGNMKLNIVFAGKVKDMKQYAENGTYQSDASGTIGLAQVSLKLKQNPLEYKNINGQFLLHDNHIDVQDLSGLVSSTDFQLKGSLKNFITYLLIPGQDANMNVAVTSKLIDLNEILENKSVSTEEDTSYKIKINPRLVCNLTVSADKLIFRQFEATAISGQIHIEDQIITSQNLRFESMEGNVSMSASIATQRRDSVLMACRATVTKLNITELFRQMENFGEEVITDKHLKGKLTADVDFRSSWSKDLRINPSKVVASADITIDNGELNNFMPVLSLSKYLKLADLKAIRFSTLKNQIRIYDRKIFFPSMEIRSTALNLNASGTHDFDNVVDYKLNMLLSDVMGKKVKSQQTEFGVIEDDGLGRTRLFIAMKGPADDPRFSYDNKSVSQKIAQDMRADRQNVKQLLKQEFGLFKKDTALTQAKGQGQKKEEMQVDWEESGE